MAKPKFTQNYLQQQVSLWLQLWNLPPYRYIKVLSDTSDQKQYHNSTTWELEHSTIRVIKLAIFGEYRGLEYKLHITGTYKTVVDPSYEVVTEERGWELEIDLFQLRKHYPFIPHPWKHGPQLPLESLKIYHTIEV